MILPFLTAPERQGYQQVPATLSETDLRQHFYLESIKKCGAVGVNHLWA